MPLGLMWIVCHKFKRNGELSAKKIFHYKAYVNTFKGNYLSQKLIFSENAH